jgi:hypothetical protein
MKTATQRLRATYLEMIARHREEVYQLVRAAEEDAMVGESLETEEAVDVEAKAIRADRSDLNKAVLRREVAERKAKA